MIFLWNSPLSNFLLDHSRVAGDPIFEKKGPFHLGTSNHCSSWWTLKGCGLWLSLLRLLTDLLDLSLLILLETISPPGWINCMNHWSFFGFLSLVFAGDQEKEAHQLGGNCPCLYYTTWSASGADIIGVDMVYVPTWTKPRKCSAVFSENHLNLPSVVLFGFMTLKYETPTEEQNCTWITQLSR